jgi:hypothetical protein
MRKLLFVACSAMCIFAMPLAGAHPVSAQDRGQDRADYFRAPDQCTCGVTPRAVSLLGQRGPALRAATALLLERDPRVADEMVCASRRAAPDQKIAIGQGIADAARFFALCRWVPTESCRATEAYLRQAMICADFETRAAFNQTIASDMAASDIAPTPPIFIPGIGGANAVTRGATSGANCVSPAAPNGC